LRSEGPHSRVNIWGNGSTGKGDSGSLRPNGDIREKKGRSEEGRNWDPQLGKEKTGANGYFTEQGGLNELDQKASGNKSQKKESKGGAVTQVR